MLLSFTTPEAAGEAVLGAGAVAPPGLLACGLDEVLVIKEKLYFVLRALIGSQAVVIQWCIYSDLANSV